MNVWTLDKDLALKALLVRLTNHFSEDVMLVIDPTPEDSSSIGLAKPDEPEIWAYVYTYGQTDEHYGIHLQFPKLPDNEVDGVIDAQENVSFEQLIELLAMHLDIPDN